MGNQKIQANIFAAAVLLIAVLIIVTRGVGLTYNMEIHPDENKFYWSTDSLLQSLLDPEVEFKEAKEYPEGAYLFQLPFQALGMGVAALTGGTRDLQLWGRISSVFYFTLAVVIGMLILYRYLGKSKTGAVLFGLTMCFSLFFIEHSKYGVGDMISIFLLMLILFLTATACTAPNRRLYLLLAFAASGAMGAVKYPQVIFALIPLSVLFLNRHALEKKQRNRLVLLCLGVMFVTFLLFSPKAMFDWKYFYRVIRRESDAYVLSGTAFEAGGLLNHIATMAVYSLFYSDFPLALLLLAAVLFRNLPAKHAQFRKGDTDGERTQQLVLSYVVPAVGLFFFGYNLLPTLLIFRTYTPYFAIAALYASVEAAKLLKKGGWQKWAVAALTVFMVLRGSGLIGLTSAPGTIREEFARQVYGATDENWSKTLTMGQYIIPFEDSGLIAPEKVKLSQLADSNGAAMELEPGTLLITGAYPFAFGSGYLLPLETPDAGTIALWQSFVQANEAYLVYRAYPDYVYYLYGGWLRGGTLSTSMIPCNYVFYRP